MHMIELEYFVFFLKKSFSCAIIHWDDRKSLLLYEGTKARDTILNEFMIVVPKH